MENLLRLIALVPLPLRRAFFNFGAGLFSLFSPRYRLIALHGLTRAFPEKDEKEIRRILKGVYRNFGTIGAEFFDLLRLSKENIHRFVEVEGHDNYLKAKEKGRGVLIFAAHFGNWEMQIASVALLVEPIAVVYRPLDNPVLEGLFRRVRSAQGITLIKKQGAMKQIAGTLKQNGVVGIMIDQNMAWQEGVFVDFFGRPACTTGSIASLAATFNAAVLPSFFVRQPDGRYRLIMGPPVEMIKTGDEQADIVANTQRFTALVEAMVRRYPEQWLWLHHRWKTKRCQAGV